MRMSRAFLGLFLGFLLFSVNSTATGDVGIIGSWVAGTSHSKEAGTDRALVFTAHVETNKADTNLGSVTYGGQSMTKVVDGIYTSGLSAYTAAFILDETGISAASGSSFVVSWNVSPSGTPDFSSVFLQDVNQSSLTGATGTGGGTTTTVETAALSTSNGDMAIVAGTNGNSGGYSTINGFTEAIEVEPSSADGVAGYLSSTGGNVTPGISHTSVNRQSVIGFVVNAGAVAPVPPGQASNPTPSNEDINISINADLGWTAGSGATSHDVYFGQDSTPDAGEFQVNQGGTTFDPGTMNTATTYYWRIDEVNAYGTTTGTVWNFTTTSSADIYNVKDYGATGNGSTSDTDAINDTIAAADAGGGGTVYFPTGTYRSGSIIMKDNITLDISANATLLATSAAEYSLVDDNPWDMYQDWGHSHWKSSLIWGVGVNNVAITGTGRINGSAMTAGDPADYYGDRAISFKLCSGILIEDIEIYRGGHFCIITMGCNDVTIDNVLMDTNRDGINIDCCNDVNIVDCVVNSPKDDAICMKSSYGLGYKRPTENVTISRCTVMGHAVGYLLNPPGSDEGWHAGRIKFGTESNGGFKNITITDCNFEYCYGFMLATVDGGDIENIIISNIQMTDLFSPAIFMRLGNRARGPGPPPPGIYRNINISNITAEADHSISCIMSGMPGHYIEDVNFSNINIVYPGGGPATWADKILGENERGSPDAFMFGTVTPSNAFYVRHAKGVEFHDCDFSFDTADQRPAFVLVDVNGFELDNVDSERYYTSGDHIKFDDVDDVNIHDCPDFPSTTVSSYDDMEPSEYKITTGKPFTVTISATAASTGISTTDMLMDSNYLDTGYSWLNAGTPKDVELSDVRVYSLGEHRLEIGVCDVNIGICPLGDFDLTGKTDSNDYVIFAADWLRESVIILQNDPVAWWKLDDGGGIYASDFTGNGNTGTLNGGLDSRWVTGYDGGALDFDGDNDYIRVNDSVSISVGASDYTICAWIYPHSINGDRGIVAKIKNNSDKEYALSLGNDGAPDGALVLDVEVGANDGAESTDAVVVTTNEWHHVMVAFDAATAEAHFFHNFDPVPVVSDSITVANIGSGDDLCIGRWGGSYNDKEFDGLIDDVRIYNYEIGLEVRPTDLCLDYIIDFNDLEIFTDNWLTGEVLDI